MPSNDFILLDREGWLHGTIRTLSCPRRCIWIDLLLMAKGRFPGYVALGMEGGKLIGWSVRKLAAHLGYRRETLQQALDEFVRQGRIEISETGAIRIVNWDKYQFIPSYAGDSGDEDAPESGPKADHSAECGAECGPKTGRDADNRAGNRAGHDPCHQKSQNLPTGGINSGSRAGDIVKESKVEERKGSTGRRLFNLTGRRRRLEPRVPEWDKSLSVLDAGSVLLVLDFLENGDEGGTWWVDNVLTPASDPCATFMEKLSEDKDKGLLCQAERWAAGRERAGAGKPAGSGIPHSARPPADAGCPRCRGTGYVAMADPANPVICTREPCGCRPPVEKEEE